MADVEPGPSNDYQVSPTLAFSRARWNAVMASIAARLKARELLEATFETLIANGTQAALDLISQNVAPQLEDLIEQINALEEQLEDIIGGGTAPNALQLGGQNPSFYRALENATGILPVAKVSGVDTLIAAAVAALVNGSPAALDTLKELSDALGGDANFAASVAAALGGKAVKASNLSDLTDKDAALVNLLGGGAGIALFKAATVSAQLSALGITDRLVPVGTKIDVIGSVAPAGFVKLNGALLSRSAYSDLWAYAQACGAFVSEAAWASANQGCFSTGDGSTTFRLPDWRGEFGRAWDDGRGIDSGRGIGTVQGQSTQAHKHVLPIGFDNGNLYGWRDGDGNPVFGSILDAGAARNRINFPFDGANARVGKSDFASDLSGETRPRNVSYLACIKY